MLSSIETLAWLLQIIIDSFKIYTDTIIQVQAILEGVIELRNENIDLVEIQGTVEEVTKDKARRAAEAVCPIVFSPQFILD